MLLILDLLIKSRVYNAEIYRYMRFRTISKYFYIENNLCNKGEGVRVLVCVMVCVMVHVFVRVCVSVMPVLATRLMTHQS